MLYRRHQGLDLTSTHKVAIPQPVVDHEAEYDSVLVPLGDGGYDESVVATAAKLAARKRRGIHVLALVTVPDSLPIGARMPEAEAAAESLIEQAKVRAGARVSGHIEQVRSGQAGRRIIEEAIDMRAAAIVMPLPRAHQRRVAVRQDARDRARRAAVPGDHRVPARRARRPRQRRRGAGEGA